MTMEHIERSFRVTLAICHPSIDPAEITKTIRLQPKQATRSGSVRRTPAGSPLEGTYKFSCWRHEFGADGAREFGELLQTLIEGLQQHRAFFHQIVQEGGSVELFCGVLANGNWDEVIPYPLLGKLADLRINLRLDVYPNQSWKR